jgi:hypothetical protein
MTTQPTLNGQILGQAERGARALLDRVLDANATTFDQWVALRFLHAGDDAPEAGAFTEFLGGALRIDRTAGQLIVDQLVGLGWASLDHDHLALTSGGVARHDRIAAAAAAIAAQLYGGLDSDDLLAAARVLIAVKERADAALAA